MKKVTSVIKAILILIPVLILSGCFGRSADDLYSLPQAPDEYIQLQSKINEVLAAGAEYAAPVSGSNRRAVQLKDLDGDGIEEAIAFFRTTGERPLKIYIFVNIDDSYEVAAIIDGDGTAIESIDYIEMDGDGIKEVVVGMQISPSIKLLSVYSIRDFQISSLISADYTEYTVFDMNSDSKDELMILRHTASDLSGEVEMISLMNDGEIASSSAKMSNGVESISRVKTGRLSDGNPTLLVESVYYGNSIVTDVFTYWNSSIRNITMEASTGISGDTVRTYNVYCTDINDDGVIDVPFPKQLYAQSETVYYLLEWHSFDSRGIRSLVMATYHNYSDGWYIVLPSSWRSSLTVRREDIVAGERAVVFSTVSGRNNDIDDMFVIYTLSGDNKEERAKLDDRFILISDRDKIYAAKILNESGSVDSLRLRESFKLIFSEWVTGAT